MSRKNRLSKRQAAREKCTELLESIGATFEIKNNGAHYIITAHDGVINFWPKSEKWHYNGEKMNMGINSLIERLVMFDFDREAMDYLAKFC